MSNAAAIFASEIRPPSEALEMGRIAARYGLAAEAGFQAVPDVLLFNQAELGLRSEDLNVLLQVSAHWFFADKMPFPRPTSIAKRMGVSERTVQRSLTRLRKLGLIGKTKNADGRLAVDLMPLVERLQPFAEKRLYEKALAQSQAQQARIGMA